MEEIWQQIFEEYQRLSVDIIKDFNEGADSESIEELKNLTDHQLPDIYQSYSVHNGQNSYRFSLMYPWKLYDIENILSNYEVMNTEVVEQWAEEDISPDEYAEAEGPIQEIFWHSKWIPIASNGGGDLICVDLAPASGGNIGQIIAWYHETAFKEIKAESYRQWLEDYLRDLKNGLYFYEEGKGLVKQG